MRQSNTVSSQFLHTTCANATETAFVRPARQCVGSTASGSTDFQPPWRRSERECRSQTGSWGASAQVRSCAAPTWSHFPWIFAVQLPTILAGVTTSLWAWNDQIKLPSLQDESVGGDLIFHRDCGARSRAVGLSEPVVLKPSHGSDVPPHDLRGVTAEPLQSPAPAILNEALLRETEWSRHQQFQVGRQSHPSRAVVQPDD